MAQPKSGSVQGMEENLKKGVTELLVLTLLSREEMHPPQILQELEVRSGGALTITFPYSALYRLEEHGYLELSGRRIASDGRRRQYYRITEAGREYQKALAELYQRFNGGVQQILKEEKSHEWGGETVYQTGGAPPCVPQGEPSHYRGTVAEKGPRTVPK